MADQEYEQWLVKADTDEHSIRVLIKGKGSPETVAFLSHQIAEKCLKGYLVWRGQPYPKIHQIEHLLSLCGEIDPSFAKYKEDGVFLSEFYLESRYPGSYEPVTWKDAQKAFAAAGRIRNAVLGMIKN